MTGLPYLIPKTQHTGAAFTLDPEEIPLRRCLSPRERDTRISLLEREFQSNENRRRTHIYSHGHTATSQCRSMPNVTNEDSLVEYPNTNSCRWFNPDSGAGGYGFGNWPGNLAVNAYDDSKEEPYTAPSWPRLASGPTICENEDSC